jgi:hypothetical protein
MEQPPIRRVDDPAYDLGNLSPLPAIPFRKLDPIVRLLWVIGKLIFWGVLFMILLVVGIFTSLADRLPSYLPLIGLAMAALALLHIIWPVISYPKWGYALRHHDFLLRSGVLWKRVIAVPFARIQHVDSDAGPLERSFGVANLVIHTAGSQLGAVVVPGLPAEQAEALRDYLSEVGHTHANI